MAARNFQRRDPLNAIDLELRRLVLRGLIECLDQVIKAADRAAVHLFDRVAIDDWYQLILEARLESRKQNQLIPIVDGDTIEQVDGRSIRSLDDLVKALDQSSQNEPAQLQIYRVEWIATLEMPRGHLLPGATAEERLGIQRWSSGRDRRATGFYNHWTTYAESLQLIGSLALGLFVALPIKKSRNGLLVGAAIAGICGALLLSVTRASWLSFLLSAILIATLSLSRRALILVGLCAIPVVLAGLFVLHQKRNVGFVDQKDDSIVWRQKIWREGFHLLTSNPRHLAIGVGMD